MKTYIEELIKPSGLIITPEATEKIEKAVKCYIDAFVEEAKILERYHQEYNHVEQPSPIGDNGIRQALYKPSQAIIYVNARQKYFEQIEGECEE